MRLSEYYIPTLKETPSEAAIKSHQLMLRAGLVRMLAAGIYSYLPLGWKILKKIMQIVREEMDAIGGQEVFLPALNPRGIWDETGRASDFGDEMFHFFDRKESEMCLAPTHEEIICSIARNDIRSYKKLPQIWYQIQNKFRDEPRPRSGLLRTRQFLMKDSYTLDYNEEGLDTGYNKHAQAYKKIFKRCGLKFFEVGASSGLMGGSASQEFMVESETGEDTVALCDNCGYAANAEIASFKVELIKDSSPYSKLEEISTPDKRTINEVSKFLNLDSKYFMKSLVYVIDSQIVFILLRGDYELNESKMIKTFGATFRQATPEEVLKTCKANIGFISPVGIKGIPVYVDNTIKDQKSFVSGANKDHFHLGGIDPKDFQITKFVDVASVKNGDICSICNKPLRVTNAIELGHIFKLGTKYSKSMGATVLDQNGKKIPIIMGSYGIGIERIMAAFIEQNADKYGLVWDFPISPFDVHLLPINYKNDLIKKTSNTLYQDLRKEGLDCLIDDRDFAPGFKFSDADLIGIPLQLIIGEKNVKNNKVELKYRKSGKKEYVEIKNVVSYIKNIISSD